MIENTTIQGVPMPRIKGRVIGSITEKFSWEIFVHIGDSDPLVMTTESKFNTFDLALKHLKSTAQDVCDTIVKDVFKAEPQGYLDLINNRRVENLK
jgi:hypothetical protein